MFDLKGKYYLIIGGSSGIGKDVAEFLTEVCQANVILVARRDDIIIELAKKFPGKNLAIKYDLEDINNIKDIFDKCEQNEVKIDGMVYSAGISPLFSIAENDVKAVEKVMKINALAFAEFGKFMLDEKYVNNNSSIVAISSIVSVTTTNRQSAYAASKSMLNTYVKFLAKEALGRIRVNAILPGAVDTEMMQELRKNSDNFDEKMKKSYPLGIIPPRRISEMIGYLLSDSAAYITGSLFEMDGGYLVK